MNSANDKQLKEGGLGSYIPVVVCLCAICGIPSAMLLNTASIFYPVISADLGVQTAEISAWMSLCFLACALFAPAMGRVLEKGNMRLLLIVAVVAIAAAFCVFSVASVPWMFWIVGFLCGIPNSILMGMATATLLNRWFKRFVGMLMGVCAACTGLGSIVFLQLGQYVIDTAGWRSAYLTFAAIVMVTCVPLVLFCIRNCPADKGLLPYGTAWALEHVQDQASVAKPTSVNLAVGTRSAAFALIAVFGFMLSFVCQTNAYFPKYVNYLNEQALLGAAGAAIVTGATLASVCQAGSTIGKIGLGAFSDLSVRKAIIVLSAAGVVGIVCIWFFPATVLMPIGGFVFGFFVAGILVLNPMLVRSVFGEGKNYPVFYGRISMFTQFGAAAANIVWPLIADNLGGFDMVFGIALVGVVVCCLAGMTAYGMRDKFPREE